MFPFTVNALSATTANTIQGTKPALSFNGGVTVANDVNELLGFTMPNGSGGTTEITALQSATIQAKPSYTFNDFVTQVTADNVAYAIPSSYYYDADGDLPHATPTTAVSGTVKATWSYKLPNGSTKTLGTSELSGNLDACNAPYTLTITSSAVKVTSAYGDPIDNNYGNKSKAYTINVTDYTMCYAKPLSITTRPDIQWIGWPSGTYNPITQTTPDPQQGGGYTSDFVPYAGFKATASTKFPTTGFAKAQFQLKMSNAQSDYTYSIPNNPGNGVSIDTSGNVTLNSKPTGQVTLRATPKIAGYPAIDYPFTINLWVIFKSSSATYALAKNACGGEANLLTRSELTNSPAANVAGSSWPGLYLNNSATRATGGGVMGEWMLVVSGAYPGSDLDYLVQNNYWTKDAVPSGYYGYFQVSAHGIVLNTPAAMSPHPVAVCRG